MRLRRICGTEVDYSARCYRAAPDLDRCTPVLGYLTSEFDLQAAEVGARKLAAMGIHREENVGLDVFERMRDFHGFDVRSKKVSNQLERSIDAEHAVGIFLSPWQKAPPTGGRRVTVAFSVSRQDISRLQAKLRGHPDGSWSWAASEPRPFFGQSEGVWASGDDRDEIESWIDAWVPTLVSEAPSLGFIEAWWEHTRPPAEDADQTGIWFGRYQWPRICNQLLWGWTAEAETELLEPYVKITERFGPEHRLYARRTEIVERVRSWIAEHPDGIDRQLTG